MMLSQFFALVSRSAAGKRIVDGGTTNFVNVGPICLSQP